MKVLTQGESLTGGTSTSASPVSSAYASILGFGCPSQLLRVGCAQLLGLSRPIKPADAPGCSIGFQDPNRIVPLLTVGSFFCFLLSPASSHQVLCTHCSSDRRVDVWLSAQVCEGKERECVSVSGGTSHTSTLHYGCMASKLTLQANWSLRERLEIANWLKTIKSHPHGANPLGVTKVIPKGHSGSYK